MLSKMYIMKGKANEGKFEEAKVAANLLDALATDYLKKAAQEQKKFDKMGADIDKALNDANYFTRDDVARIVATRLKNDLYQTEPPPPISAVSFLPTKVRNRLMKELQEGYVSDDDKAAMKKLLGEHYVDPEFEKLDKANREKFVESLKNDPSFKKAREDWEKPDMTPEKRLAVMQKVVDYQAAAYGVPKTTLKTYKSKNQNEMGFYRHSEGILYIHDDVLKTKGFDEYLDTAVHENAHWLQATMVDDLDAGRIKKGDPRYEQAKAFKLNDTVRGFYVYPPDGKHSPDKGQEYFYQPQEHHSRTTGDAVKKAQIGT